MNASRNPLLAAMAAFTGGLVLGLLFAPQSGRQLRGRIARRTRRPTRWVEGQVHAVEAQLAALEQQLHATSQQFSMRLREITGRAMGHYVPHLPPDPEAWTLNGGEVMRDLRRMPRS